MSASRHPTDPKKLPLTYKPATVTRDIEHQHAEWASGSRGGGKVPDDVTWVTNPKQSQEERGAGDIELITVGTKPTSA